MDPFPPLDIVLDTWLTGLFSAVSLFGGRVLCYSVFGDKDCFSSKGLGPLDCLFMNTMARCG